MATQLELVNKVLLRLREDSVTASTDNDYSQLVSEFVADIHREVVEARKWQSCYHSTSFDFVVGQRKYVLSKNITAGGDALDANTTLPNLLSIYRAGYQYEDGADVDGEPLALISYSEALRREALNNDNQVDNPYYVAISNDGTDTFAFFPYPPQAAERIVLEFDTEDAELENDGTTDNTVIKVPHRPVYLGALYMALNERGEEVGEPGNIAEVRYSLALSGAMEADMSHDEFTNQYDWRRD